MTQPSDEPQDVGPVATCHCGAVSIAVASAPSVVVACNCSLCRRYGVLWVYYDLGALSGLPDGGGTDTYAWNGKHVDFHRCRNCGCVTHWAPRAPDARHQGPAIVPRNRRCGQVAA